MVHTVLMPSHRENPGEPAADGAHKHSWPYQFVHTVLNSWSKTELLVVGWTVSCGFHSSFDLRTSYTFTEMDKETAVHLVKSVDDGMLYHLLYIILAEIQERCYVYRAPGCHGAASHWRRSQSISSRASRWWRQWQKAMKVKVFFGILPWDLVSHVHLHKFGDLEEYSWVFF